MLVLFDNGTPRDIARYLIGRHTVTEARARGWDKLENGELLTAAEAAGFEVILTTDRNLRYQQNLAVRKIAVVALGKGRWTLIKPYVKKVVAAVDAATPGSYKRGRDTRREKLKNRRRPAAMGCYSTSSAEGS
jgi:hypothetical protein